MTTAFFNAELLYYFSRGNKIKQNKKPTEDPKSLPTHLGNVVFSSNCPLIIPVGDGCASRGRGVVGH